jgi:uncharacterized membrane protein
MGQDISETESKSGLDSSKDPIRKWAGIVYLLQIISFAFGGLTLIIGVIISYLKRPDVQGTWLESHFTWQITTFWYTLALAIGGLITIEAMIGFFLVILAAIILIYRVFRGWSRWNINAPIEQSIF